MTSQPIYALRVADVYQALETSSNGLDRGEVESRLSLYGLNELTEPPRRHLRLKLLAHVTHPMALLLLSAGLLAFISRQPTLGVVIWVVVVSNAAFSFWQEYRAEQAIETLEEMLPSYAHVVRDSNETRVPANEVIPGDVLVLAEGDNIPADARLVEEFGLRVNNATLTGEAIPARKTAEASLREDLTEVERPNLVFAGTSVVSGTGRAVVYATGMLTQFGRIARLTQTVEEPPSLLMQNLTRITRFITLGAIGLGALVFFVGIFDIGLQPFQTFILAIGIIVAAVPEGLLPTVTLSLAIAVQRLAQRGVLVKKLAVVETLGTISVICTDKSGTLTQNQMTVREVWVAGHRLRVSGVGYDPKGKFIPSPTGTPFASDLTVLLTAATLCNNARLLPPSPEHPNGSALGDQTEAALRVLAIKGNVDEQALLERLPRVHELPFDARRKRMTTVHKNGIAFTKGAPREVLQLCTHILIHGEVLPLDEAMRAEIVSANDGYARGALRVLAFARRELPPRTELHQFEIVEQHLTFLGLAAMMDPPRPEVAEAMQICHQAGIRVVMITGDYGLTAESLARRVGMVHDPNPRILTGAEADEMSDAQLQTALDSEVICARMAPEHKLRLVAAFQKRGDVVAVVGDGVNDAPALRKADVGLVMGLTGSDVAKEAADVILTKDNVLSITEAIQEGRAIYENLRKFVTYIFASNVPEIVPFVAMALFNVPLALTVAQILAIDLGTDLLPALALGTEHPEPEVMQHPPRRRDKPLLDSALMLRAFLWLGLIETALCYLGFFGVYYLAGYCDFTNLPRADLLPFSERLAVSGGSVYILATTMFHAGVITSQIGNAFACRTVRSHVRKMGWFRNRFLLFGITVELGLILALIYFPPLARLFEHLPIPPYYWVGLVLYAPVLYVLDWIRRNIALRFEAGQEQPTGESHPPPDATN